MRAVFGLGTSGVEKTDFTPKAAMLAAVQGFPELLILERKIEPQMDAD
jgi:hypothetical protein